MSTTALRPESNVVRLVIPGAPVGKGRPRLSRRGVYTPPKTKQAEKNVRVIWRDAGGQRLPEGAIVATIQVFLERPATHFTSKGALSALGRRTPFPISTPDCDNIAKLFMDSLNGRAYRDDAQIVDLRIRRMWVDDARLAAPLDAAVTVLTLFTALAEPTAVIERAA